MEVVTTPAAYTFACNVIEDMLSTPPRTENSSGRPREPSTDTNSCVRGINYSKWDSLIEGLEADEEEKVDKEAENYWSFAGRCAHDKSQEREIFEKPTREKLLAAQRFHREGNKAYASQNYSLASLYYRKALLQIDYSFPDTSEEEAWMENEKLASHLNMALCKLKQFEWREALLQCRLALQLDPKNIKAHYRRGLAYLALDDYTHAEEALRAALSICPADRDILLALKTLKQKRRLYQEKQKRLFQKIVVGSTIDSETFSELESRNEIDREASNQEAPNETLKRTSTLTLPSSSCFSSMQDKGLDFGLSCSVAPCSDTLRKKKNTILFSSCHDINVSIQNSESILVESHESRSSGECDTEMRTLLDVAEPNKSCVLNSSLSKGLRAIGTIDTDGSISEADLRLEQSLISDESIEVKVMERGVSVLKKEILMWKLLRNSWFALDSQLNGFRQLISIFYLLLRKSNNSAFYFLKRKMLWFIVLFVSFFSIHLSAKLLYSSSDSTKETSILTGYASINSFLSLWNKSYIFSSYFYNTSKCVSALHCEL